MLVELKFLILGAVGIAVLFFYIGNILGYREGWDDGYEDAMYDWSEETWED